MGRKSRDKQNRKMNSQKLADSESKATTTDKKEISKSSSEEMQAAGNFPRFVTEEAEGRKGRNRSNEDIKAKKPTTCIVESDMLDKLSAASKNLFLAQYQQGSSSLSEKLRDFDNHLKCHHPMIFKKMATFISAMEKLRFQNYSYVIKALSQMPRIEAFEALTEMEDGENKANETMTFAFDKDKDYRIQITEENSGKDRRKVEINNCDDFKRHPHSIQKSTTEEKVEKDGNEISGSIQEKEKTHNMDLGNGARRKIIKTSGENLEKTQYYSKLTHSPHQKYKAVALQELKRMMRKQLTSLYSENKTVREILNQNKSLSICLRELKSLYFFEKTKEEQLEVFKEKFDQEKDTNIELEDVEGYKKKREICSSIDHTEISDQNAYEGNNEEKTYIKDMETANNDIEDSDSSKGMLNLGQEIEYYDRRDNEKETMNSKQAKKVEKQATYLKLDKQENNNTDMNSKQIITKDVREFPPETEPLKDVANVDSKEETRDEINYVDGRKDEKVATAAELDNEANEEVIDLNKEDCIHFRFGINHNKRILASNHNDYLLKENEGISFNYKDENVQVRFTDNQVLILTKDSEFNIFIQKSDPVNFTDKATQTST